MTTNLDFENIFNSTYELSLNRQAYLKEDKIIASTEVFDSAVSPQPPQEQYQLQQLLRPIFGKEGINTSPIGTHPNFINLENTEGEIQHHYTSTFFIDIKGSTRLSLLYPLEDVFHFKNAVIKTCIEVIRSLDGHVHRIMGDAVMAFFAQGDNDKEDSIANTINCAVTLRMMLEEGIKPWMEKKGFDGKDFAFRVGCDFGDTEDVLWGSYGYIGVGEVSATGLQVDMASKLQNLANKNQTMLGQSIIKYVDLPDYYLKIKTITQQEKKVLVPYVKPNLTKNDETPINYSMRILEYKKFIELSPLPINTRRKINRKIVSNPLITYKCYIVSDTKIKLSEYISSSKFLDKETALLFEVTAIVTGRLRFPLRVEFTKTNHGEDAQKAGAEGTFRPVTKYIYNSKPRYGHSSSRVKTTNDESTSYRGLHTMECTILKTAKALLYLGMLLA